MMMLVDLPFDVKLQILASSRPLDIIRGFRQVSRNLREVSTNYSLWKGILQRVYLENKILWSSSAMDSMSIKDMEHAATLPSRFTSSLFLSSQRETGLKVYSKQSFYLVDRDMRHNGFLPGYLRRFNLIPGGRYLLSEHDCPFVDGFQAEENFDSVRIVLWDLQAARGSPLCVKPIASLKGQCCVASLQPTSNGKGFLMFTYNVLWFKPHTSHGGNRDVSIYEIYPENSQPIFHLIATHNPNAHVQGPVISPGRGIYSLTSQNVVMVEQCEITVWNFLSDTTRTWRVPIEDESYNFVALKKTHVVLCSKTSISIWEIPVLQPSGSALASQIQTMEPCCKMNFTEHLPKVISDQNMNNYIAHFLSLDNWYHDVDSYQPFYVDYILNHTSNPECSGTVFRYRIDFPTAGAGPSIPHIRLMKRAAPSFFSEPSLGIFSSGLVPDSLYSSQPGYCLSNNQIFLSRIQTRGSGEITSVKVTIHSEASPDSDPSDKVQVALGSSSSALPPALLGFYQFELHRHAFIAESSGFCPTSGRMCYVNVLDARWNKFGPSLIEIVDFLPRPDERRTITQRLHAAYKYEL